MKAACKRGDLAGQDVAMLIDRIAVNRGEPQIYGSQVAEVDPGRNVFRLHPVRDSANLDRRRMKMQLMPIDKYRQLMEMASPRR